MGDNTSSVPNQSSKIVKMSNVHILNHNVHKPSHVQCKLNHQCVLLNVTKHNPCMCFIHCILQNLWPKSLYSILIMTQTWQLRVMSTTGLVQCVCNQLNLVLHLNFSLLKTLTVVFTLNLISFGHHGLFMSSVTTDFTSTASQKALLQQNLTLWAHTSAHITKTELIN